MGNPGDSNKNASAKKPEKSADREEKHHQKIIAYGGLVGLVVLSLQWCEMHKATIEATNATKAAIEANKSARELAHLDQRAWVATFQVPAKGMPQVGSEFIIQIPIKNTGRTFARDVTIDGDIMFKRIDAKPEILDTVTQGTPVKHLLLSPGGEYLFTLTTINLWDSTWDNRIKYGPYKALVAGRITYYDIFDCVHWTIYCFVFDAKRGEWNIYEKHNDADNDRCDEPTTK